MTVTVHFMAQLRIAAGRTSEEVSLADGACAGDCIAVLARRHAALGRLLVDADGRPQPTLLLFVGDEQVDPAHPLRDGDRLTLLTPIAGGSR